VGDSANPRDQLAAEFLLSSELCARIVDNLAAFHPVELNAQGLRHAAVGVVLVADEQKQACFVLTRRVATLRRHAGQWALPGGQIETDETPQAAALREIKEEVSIQPSACAVLGRLDDFVSRSGHLITPLVVWTDPPVVPHANPEEVDAVFRVPLRELDDPYALRTTPLLHFSMPTLATTVHAPTAAILYQFREVALHGREVRVADVEQPRFAWQ
jgi:8-oxo-dGTP pyrophosphatase MutT (NUDIX family)